MHACACICVLCVLCYAVYTRIYSVCDDASAATHTYLKLMRTLGACGSALADAGTSTLKLAISVDTPGGSSDASS
jgi:hypothetical protein